MHKLYRVLSFQIVGPYTLSITFDDDSSQVIDFEPILYGEIYSPLRDLAFFDQVRLDPEVDTLVWPNDADFDPETLRNWPLYKEEWIKRSQRWALTPA
ncbi:MAG: DUF2442 domain-containing protein [Chloroflexota bacterium]|nr:DUF2442 domain-containing protein [Chloroflexota bacterium]